MAAITGVKKDCPYNTLPLLLIGGSVSLVLSTREQMNVFFPLSIHEMGRWFGWWEGGRQRVDNTRRSDQILWRNWDISTLPLTLATKKKERFMDCGASAFFKRLNFSLKGQYQYRTGWFNRRDHNHVSWLNLRYQLYYTISIIQSFTVRRGSCLLRFQLCVSSTYILEMR